MKRMFALGVIAAGLAVSSSAVAATYSIIHDFTGTDGQFPTGGLLRDAGGNLYGVTEGGGTGCVAGCGVVFKLSPPASGQTAWTYTVLHYFTGGADGHEIHSGLVSDTGAALYGTAAAGGSGNGTVFKLTPPPAGQTAWAFNVIHTFGLAVNGSGPTTKLLIDASGVLYGTTEGGGKGKAGVIFKLTPPPAGKAGWGYSILHDFAPSPGKAPYADPSGLIADATGTLYGDTGQGGSSNIGTVFSLAPPSSGQTAWKYAVIHTFGPAANGMFPAGSLLLAKNGALVGVTVLGGPRNDCAFDFVTTCGLVYQLAPPAAGASAWTYSKLRTLRNFAAGASPTNTPTQDEAGAIYIAASYGGTKSCGRSDGCGVILSLDQPTNSVGELTETRLHVFNYAAHGWFADSPLLIGANRTFYGEAGGGGTQGHGVIYELTE